MTSPLPVVMELSSWVPQPARRAAPAAAVQLPPRELQSAGTITCPLTGEEIPACCCPLKQ